MKTIIKDPNTFKLSRNLYIASGVCFLIAFGLAFYYFEILL